MRHKRRAKFPKDGPIGFLVTYKFDESFLKHPIPLPGIKVRPHHLPVVEAPKYHGAFYFRFEGFSERRK